MESRPYSWVALDPDCDHPLDEKEKEKDKKKKENVIAMFAVMAMGFLATTMPSLTKIWLRQISINKSPMKQLLSETLVISTFHLQTFKQ